MPGHTVVDGASQAFPDRRETATATGVRRAPRGAVASLAAATTVALLAACDAGAPQDGAAPTTEGAQTVEAFGSTFAATVRVEPRTTVLTESDGDLWPMTWADDGALYTANGDGTGFSDLPWSDIVVNRVDGDPETGLTGERLAEGAVVGPIWSDTVLFNRKPTGIVAVDGDGDGRDELYLAVQDLRKKPDTQAFDEAPAATIVRSDDYGRTWHWDREAPMFDGHVFTTIMFLDLGQSNAHASLVEAGGEGYVYAYGLDHNWRDSFSDTVTDPTDLFLARVPAASVQDRATWEFFAGAGDDGPRWSTSIEDRTPVLSDSRRVYEGLAVSGAADMSVLSQGSVVYNPGLDRYLYTSWTEYTWEIYEAPNAWGPWEHLAQEDFGPYPWTGTGQDGGVHGGYGVVVPSKFISADGRTMWAQSNWFVGAPSVPENTYRLALRRLVIEPRGDAPAQNAPDATRNLALEDGAVPLVTHARLGLAGAIHDGELTTVADSNNRTPKTTDVWGLTWPSAHRVNEVTLVHGEADSRGGRFVAEPTVEVRRDGRWQPVDEVSVSPGYGSGPATAGDRYTFSFPDVVGDGIRLVGEPGGAQSFTTVAELEVHLR
ncbi:DUF4185 domain-containing protein [Actinotalea sp. BY-33]|uniref:DUF4185 domain-containing protein n=1 Tax=Actinotalea soli TaxID=2819234 RepID=A0A939LPU5_9CELL|nr:DUF4185 domain-containing protein [Actinotalea soli]MBO1752131.1 DUF4185 domain-containing protein [Actinotalea soli]